MSVWLPVIELKLCTGCGECVKACPAFALALVNGKAVLAQPDRCTYCAVCEAICPAGAIELPYLICKSGVCGEENRDNWMKW